MSLTSVSRPLVLLPVVWALSLHPATAQEQRAKDGWDMLRNSLAEAGLRVSSEGITESDTGLEVSGVTIRPAHGRGVLRLPMLGVEPRGSEGFAFIPASGATLELTRSGPGVDALELDFDGALLFNRQADGMRLAPAFERIEARFEGPAGFGSDRLTTLQIGLDDFEGEIGMTEGAQVDLTGEVRVALLSYAQDWAGGFDADADLQQRETAEIDNLTVRFSIDALDVLAEEPVSVAAIFEQGFGLQAVYEAAASRSSSLHLLDGEQFRVESASGHNDTTLSLLDGRLEVDGTASDFLISGAFGVGEGQFSGDRMYGRFALPLVMTEDMQDFGLTLEMDGMQASEESWMMLGAQTFADETADLALELAAEGRWLVDPMQAESTDEPVDLAAIRLDRLSLRLGQALFEGSGRFDTDRDAGSLERAMEMGRGAFTFILRGGEALLARLGSEGVLPADQAFLAQMMMGALARQVGEDHLESLVTITPPGQVMVNGMPLPF